MNKIAAVKLVAKLIVGSGTTTVTRSIIRNNVTPDNMIQEISVAVASLVIGSMAASATTAHTDARIDELATAWENANKSKDDDTTVTV